MRRLPSGLLLSTAIHVALVLGLVAALGSPAPRLLFVDLVRGFGGGGAPAAGDASTGGAPPPAPAAPHAAAPRAAAPSPRPPAAPPRAMPPPAAPMEIAPPPALAPSVSLALESAPPSPAPSAAATPPPSSGGGTTPGGGAAVRRVSPSAGAGDGGGAVAAPGGRGSGSGTGGAPAGREGGTLALAVPGDGGGAEYAGYLALLRQRITDSTTYPTAARRRGLTGTVQLEVEIEPTGAIGAVLLAVSSSHRLLDDAALEAVRGLERVPFPAGVRPRRLRVQVPVVFDLR